MPPSVPDSDGPWRCIGRHRLRVEPDNTVYMKFIGPLSLKEIEEITQQLIAVRQTGPFYMLSDLSEAGVPTAEARKQAGAFMAKARPQALAMFGASILVRAAGEMMAAIARMTKRDVPILTYTRTEAEARAWLAARRRQSGK